MRFLCALLIVLFVFPAAAFAVENYGMPDTPGISSPEMGYTDADNPASSYDTPGASPGLPSPDAGYTSAVSPVSVDEFKAKISRIMDLAIDLSGGILVQVAIFMMIASALITAVGWLFRLSGPRDLGIRGLVMSSFGLLIFWSIPFIVRMINSVASILNS